jgi:hypothetical protein
LLFASGVGFRLHVGGSVQIRPRWPCPPVPVPSAPIPDVASGDSLVDLKVFVRPPDSEAAPEESEDVRWRFVEGGTNWRVSEAIMGRVNVQTAD